MLATLREATDMAVDAVYANCPCRDCRRGRAALDALAAERAKADEMLVNAGMDAAESAREAQLYQRTIANLAEEIERLRASHTHPTVMIVFTEDDVDSIGVELGMELALLLGDSTDGEG